MRKNKTKCIIVFLLLFSVISSSFMVAYASNEESFTAEEAMKLFEDAERLYLALENGDKRKVNGVETYFTWDMSDYKDNVLRENLFGADKLEDFFHYRVTSYVSGTFTFSINDRTDLNKLAGLYFADGEEFIDNFQEYFKSYQYTKQVSSPIFITEEDKVYHLMLEEFDLYDREHYVLDRESWFIDDLYSDFVVSGNRASINLLLLRKGIHVDCVELLRMPVEFIKTDAGWRISEDIFNSILHNRDKETPYEGPYRRYLVGEWNEQEWTPINPNTSDPTVPAIAILGTVAVISLALPVIIYKRRRRAA